MLRVIFGLSFVISLLSADFCHAGWPFSKHEDECEAEAAPHWGTAEYYEMHANDPPGARQKYKHGKLWPPFARPTGPKQPLIHRYHTAHYWPYPYVIDDRDSVSAFAEVQVMNGWMEACTFYEYHFDPVTNELNDSGQTLLHWILVSVPEGYRQAHVAVSKEPAVTSAHIASVESNIHHMAGSIETHLAVLPRLAEPVGRPAAEVEQIFDKALQGMPSPVLQQGAAAGGGASSSTTQ